MPASSGAERAAEVLVLGGGLAGAAAAIVLARAGRRVTLVEREREPRHKVCGEFLSAEALTMLGLLGIDVRELGAVAVHGVRLCGPRGVTERPLPFAAMSLTRRRLDPALLRLAEAAGARVLCGVSVEGLTRREGGWRASLSDGREVAAAEVILATGKHDLRGEPRPAGSQGNLVALKMYLRLQPEQAAALSHHVELLLHPGGYTGLEAVEDTAGLQGQGTAVAEMACANLCCLVERERLSRIGGWAGLLAEMQATCPQAGQRLAGAEPLLERPLAVASIPYGFVRRRAAGEGLWAVGDQAAVIPSFTGDGMSIALYSGLRAAFGMLRGETADAFQRTLYGELRGQVARATAISRGLVFEPSRAMLLSAVAWWPGLLQVTARMTRLRAQAMADIEHGF